MTATDFRTVNGRTIATIRDCRECGLAEHDVVITKTERGAGRYLFTCPQERRPVEIISCS
jgi:hypothetical protein